MLPNGALAEALAHVYWVCGASGAAKSTVARRLAAAHGMAHYSTDDAMRDHAARCNPEECPQLQAFKSMTMDERWATRTPEVMLDTFHWYQGEGFGLIIEDLLALPREKRIVVDGFRPLPRLVKPLLASPRQAIWLIPTPEFRLKAFEARGTMWDIPNKTTQPERALQNLLTRDALFTEHLQREAEAEHVATLVVDGTRSEEELYTTVAAHFGL